MEQLTLLGGPRAIPQPLPHDVWPPPGADDELRELAAQRNIDISIRGRTGPIAELEEKFRNFLDGKVKHAITFNSGTSALLSAYFAVGIETGSQVIGPALTYHAALSPMYVLGGEAVLADVDVMTRCIDPGDIEWRITDRTRAITVVHQWGHPADMDAILPLARKHRLAVIEDCSHAHGSRYKGRFCGTFGDVAVFSLQTNKAIFAGEGGILVTNNDRYADRAVLFGHYRDRSREDVLDPDLKKFWVTGFGLKLRMSPFNAIVALHSLRNFPQIKAERHRCLNYFRARLAGISYLEPPFVSADVDMGAWYGFKPMYKPEVLGIPRGRLIEALRAEGMEIDGPSGPTLSTQPLYSATTDPLFPSGRSRVGNEPSNTPRARMVENDALSLPTFWRWERDKPIIDAYIAAFQKIERNAERLRADAGPA
jgi:dTDP-4-amino-4,6-dideoxygalactose transaminase